MKSFFLPVLLMVLVVTSVHGQGTKKAEQAIHMLIDNYSKARETQDTVLLRSILTPDIDQLVSSGEWREGMKGAMTGMARSTETNPGTRTLNVKKIRFLNPETAVVDARYTIQNPDGTARQMWSTFVVVSQKGNWKITAIRNMLPSGSR
ncbi:SgcJ/EcaC family oxidoreductase [Telluribacter humicola]|uniref:SgcJ/EcaC family oxidoreductase n=1 Tax=Telluribacter humicola TaxID=1720261 RepID=UPI001A96A26A|nr:SgcJ/EcaC family oxidoreductase [Telluribacter humicola]